MFDNFLLSSNKDRSEINKTGHPVQDKIGKNVYEVRIIRILQCWFHNNGLSNKFCIKEQHICPNGLRADIVLFNRENSEESLVIECKRPRNYLTDTVFEQAREYAEALNSKNIWLTNGNDHWFWVKMDSEWISVNQLDILGIKFVRQLPIFFRKPNHRRV